MISTMVNVNNVGHSGSNIRAYRSIKYTKLLIESLLPTQEVRQVVKKPQG